MNAPRRVAVIGGGYAGLSAAVTLAAAGVQVAVFESASVLGGRARRVSALGRDFDNGQHILIGAYTRLLELMRRVGVPADAVLRLPFELRFAEGFALRSLWWPAPLGLLGGLLLARGIAFAERWGAVRFIRALRADGFRVEPDCSVDELLARHRQDGSIGRYLWRPLCVAALNTPTRFASAAIFATVLRDSLAGAADASDLLLPRVDLSRLFPEYAAEYLRSRGGEVHTGHRVRSATRELAVDGERFAAIVVAVGPHQLEPLAEIVGPIPAFGYQPIYTCYLQFPPPVRLAVPMLGLASGLVHWVFDHGALLGAAGRLACVISAQGDHQRMSKDELIAACRRELAQALGPLPDPQWTQIVAEKRATIACTPGLERCGPETATPGVFLAGDYTDPEYPPTLEAAARSGVRAAERAMESS